MRFSLITLSFALLLLLMHLMLFRFLPGSFKHIAMPSLFEGSAATTTQTVPAVIPPTPSTNPAPAGPAPGTFQGPTGEPNVKGPTGPPPNF